MGAVEDQRQRRRIRLRRHPYDRLAGRGDIQGRRRRSAARHPRPDARAGRAADTARPAGNARGGGRADLLSLLALVELRARPGDHGERRPDHGDDDVSTQVGELRLEALGVTAPAVVYEVTAAAIRDYAAATDDPAPAALDGRVASPVFAIVPVWNAIGPASKSIADDEARKRVVHFSQDMVLHRPIEAGDELF